jgi:hypothetical protein
VRRTKEQRFSLQRSCTVQLYNIGQAGPIRDAVDRAVQDGAEGTGIGTCRAEMQQLWIGTLAGTGAGAVSVVCVLRETLMRRKDWG